MTRNLYLIVGRSGTGKTTLVQGLQSQFGYRPIESYTDRPPRYPSEPGHIFVSTDTLEAMKPLVNYTVFNGFQYGTTLKMLNKCDLYVMDPPGVLYMWEHYHERPVRVIGLSAIRNACRSRMLTRGDTPVSVEKRLEHDDVLYKDLIDICDVVVCAHSEEECIGMVKKLIDFYEEKEL